MVKVFRKQHGMNIVGQGGKIILFMLPFLMAAIWIHMQFPGFAALPAGLAFLQPLGYLLLSIGLVFWGTAVIQLLIGFPQGKLVTSGAYGIVRNPIYASATFFILPAVTLITLTWVYLLPALFLYLGVMLFIGVEERQLTQAFGRQYQDYMARVDRIVPFKKPDTKPVTGHAFWRSK